ncbi:unnamed protein product [Albugo candida]|uniref:Uncharacterized protein n=1 Tax=Albugo candida TaxID=65357 RepID=A0A024FTT5_9STRA|nr:unnamed protein product [Albugo candida]|eukprot:CCI10451.1 unnamed protein product [Albugo candida]
MRHQTSYQLYSCFVEPSSVYPMAKNNPCNVRSRFCPSLNSHKKMAKPSLEVNVPRTAFTVPTERSTALVGSPSSYLREDVVKDKRILLKEFLEDISGAVH